MARDVHRLLESVGRTVDERPLQILLGRPRDRVNENVELAPFFGDFLEHRLEHARRCDVERHEDRRAELLRQWLDVGLRLLVDVRDRELGAELAKCFRAAVSDRLLVGDADDKRLRAGEHGTWDVDGHMRIS